MQRLADFAHPDRKLTESQKLRDLYDRKPVFKAGKNAWEVTDANFLQAGQHIAAYRPRLGYYHHGIYVGDGEVIDFSNEGVKKRTFADFKDGCLVYVIEHDGHSLEENIERAYKALSEYEHDYSLLRRNCEHFATGIVYDGKEQSLQCDRAAKAGAGLAIGVAVVGAIATGIAVALSGKKRDD